MPRKTKEQKELENLNMSSNTVQKDTKMSSNISNKKVNSKTKNEINKTALIIYLPSLSFLFPKQTSRQYSIR